MDLIRLQEILISMAAFILAGSIHEFAHAYSAHYLGDTTPKNSGRLTLNPLAHIDIFGSILFPLLGAFSNFPVIGWMRPVPVNPLNFRKPSKGQAISAFAGPFSNLLQASFILVIIKLLLMIFSLTSSNIIVSLVLQFFLAYFGINILLAVFNLLPVPPLDGGWILRHVLPGRMQEQFDRIYPYGIILLFILVFTGGLRVLLSPFINLIEYIFALILITNLAIVCIPFLVLASMAVLFLRDDIKLLFHRLRHHSRVYQPKNRFKPKGAKNKKQRDFAIKAGSELLEKLQRGERLNALDELALFNIKNFRLRNAQICHDNEFKAENSRCKRCDALPNCLYQSIEAARAKVYEDI
jgi:Zn-dependent protease